MYVGRFCLFSGIIDLPYTLDFSGLFALQEVAEVVFTPISYACAGKNGMIAAADATFELKSRCV